jgi:phospholipid/cholesterol/gamma-HCH transport system ATP-binding protein
MRFGEKTIFRGVNAYFPKGKITVVVGGSGMGKSTTLRLIGGLIEPASGAVRVDGQDIVGLRGRALEAARAKLGMMFQGGALLDSTSVFDNLALPLRERTSMSNTEIAHEVRRVLASVGLNEAGEKLPNELSGGMIKRVALARAMITKPVILMCDEPFSGLDPITSKRIELLLLRVNKEYGITMIVVSHDAASTLRIADHVVVLLPGGAVQGAPEELVKSADPRVSNLLSTDVDEALIDLDAHLDSAMALSPDELESTWP